MGIYMPKTGYSKEDFGEIKAVMDSFYISQECDMETEAASCRGKHVKNYIDQKSLFTKGEMYLKQGEFDRAEDYFRRILDIDNVNGGAWHHLGVIYRKQSRIDRAVVYFTNGMECGCDASRLILGAVYLEKRELKKAKEILTPLLESNPVNGEVDFLLGHIALMEGDFTQAVNLYKRAAELKNDSLKALYSAGMAFFYNNDFQRATACFEKVLAINPNYFPAENALATCKSRGNLVGELLNMLEKEQPDIENYSSQAIKASASLKSKKSSANNASSHYAPEVSIIISASEWNENLENCINHCRKLDYPHFEIITLPDRPFDHKPRAIRVVPTGHVNHPVKRNIGARQANGEILAFIDENSFPPQDWLKKAVNLLKNNDVGAAVGTAIAPLNAPYLQRAAVGIESMPWTEGIFKRNYTNPLDFEGLNQFNLLVKRDIFLAAGGFPEYFHYAKGSGLGEAIKQKVGKKVLSSRAIPIFRNCNPLYRKHLKQIARKAILDGMLSRLKPRIFLNKYQFISIFLTAVLAGGAIISAFDQSLRKPYLVFLLLYSAFAVGRSILSLNPALILHRALGFLATHIIYSLFFMRGFFLKKHRLEKGQYVNSSIMKGKKHIYLYSNDINSPICILPN